MFMGIHAVMQTVGEIIFGLTGLEATNFYLEHFVDGESEDLRFSNIATILHDMRNVLAHRWTSAAAYRYAIDYREKKGWWKGSDGIHINPSVYFESFKERYPYSKPDRDYRRLVTEEELRSRKYRFIINWLELEGKHPLRAKVKKLSTLTAAKADALEKEIQNQIAKEYRLDSV